MFIVVKVSRVWYINAELSASYDYLFFLDVNLIMVWLKTVIQRWDNIHARI